MKSMNVGYHTCKITLPVMPLTVPVTLPVPVLYFFRVTLPVQVLQKQGHHTRKRTLLVLLRNTTYNTGNVSFFNDVIGIVIYHYGLRVERFLGITIPVVTLNISMTVPVL